MGQAADATIVAIKSIQTKLFGGRIMKAGHIRVLVDEFRYLNAEIAIAGDDDYFKKN